MYKKWKRGNNLENDFINLAGFSFSEKLRDELKEYPEETKTKGMKKASSYGSDINRSATLPRSHGVSLILSLR